MDSKPTPTALYVLSHYRYLSYLRDPWLICNPTTSRSTTVTSNKTPSASSTRRTEPTPCLFATPVSTGSTLSAPAQTVIFISLVSDYAFSTLAASCPCFQAMSIELLGFWSVANILCFPVNQLCFSPMIWPGQDLRQPPYGLFRVRLPGNGTKTSLM